MEYQEKVGSHKQNMETQTRQANLAVTMTRHKPVLDKLQANRDFAAAEDAIPRT